MEFSFSPRPWTRTVSQRTPAGSGLGLHVRGRFDGVVRRLHDCALVDPEVNRLLALIRDFARARSILHFGEAPSGILSAFVLRMSRHSGEWLVALVARESTPT